MAQANLAHGPNLGPGPQFKKPCSIRLYDNFNILYDEMISEIIVNM